MKWPEDHINKLICTDCQEGMRDIPDGSIDLMVTDPPYGYAFMGKNWDKALVSISTWEECLRVLKPGAFAFIMCAPRQGVLSRQIINLEEAGFITGFSSIYWTYACITEDTEMLTRKGFKTIDELTIDDKVASLNIKTNELEYLNIKDKFEYAFDGSLINIKTKNTDQLLTLNHRVLLREKTNTRYKYKKYKYKLASELIEGGDYPRYLLPLARKHRGKLSIGEDFAELLGWIISEGHFYREKDKPNTYDIRIYQSDVNKEKVEQIRNLLNKIGIKHSEYKRNRIYKNRQYCEHCFYINGKWKEKINKWLPDKKPLWKLTQLVERELGRLFND